jgi:hypothetical protein
LILPSLFCHLASQVTKSSSADALDSLRRVVIGNEPLAAKVAAAAAFETLPTSGLKGTFVTLLALIQICLQEELAASGSEERS